MDNLSMLTANSTEMTLSSLLESDLMEGVDGFSCKNGSGGLCNRTGAITTDESEVDHELIDNMRYYAEGITLTPIALIGMIGKSQPSSWTTTA